MAKVLGVFPLELKPGVTDDQVQAFAARCVQELKIPGIEWTRIARGDRGEREGKYVAIWQLDSEATRDRYFPRPGTPSAEWEQQTSGYSWFSKQLNSLFTTSFTDYVVMGEEA